MWWTDDSGRFEINIPYHVEKDCCKGKLPSDACLSYAKTTFKDVFDEADLDELREIVAPYATRMREDANTMDEMSIYAWVVHIASRAVMIMRSQAAEKRYLRPVTKKDPMLLE